MATADALRDCGLTLVDLLRAGLSPGLVAADRITLATPDEFPDYADPRTPAVTVFLYRVAVNADLRNRPWRHLPNGARTRPLLPLELSFLITAWAISTEDEHRIIGAILQTLYDRAEIGSADLHGVGVWDSTDSVQLVLDSLPMEDAMRLWDSVDMPYRLSLAYLARVVGIEPLERRVSAPVLDADLPPGRWQAAAPQAVEAGA